MLPARATQVPWIASTGTVVDVSTETDLWDWRGGQANAERLCAGVLSIQGYRNVDPQAPLGGPDGTKDILASRDGQRYVAAVFFPPTRQSFRVVRNKFTEDRAGVGRHNTNGFIFFVNQRLTLGERKNLLAEGGPLDEIYHLERLRLVLDTPSGYGLRLEYLGRPMSVEDQIAFFSTLHAELSQHFLANERRVEAKLDAILGRTTMLIQELGVDCGPSSLESTDVVGDADASMSELTVAQLQLLHRAVTDSSTMPTALRGALRNVRVWIGNPESPSYEPPNPEDVAPQLVALLEWWRDAYRTTRKAGQSVVVTALARLHHGLLSIHPFLDANGRVARFVTDQAARELIGRGIGRELTQDHRQYSAALHAADGGDLLPLEQLIRASLN